MVSNPTRRVSTYWVTNATAPMTTQSDERGGLPLSAPIGPSLSWSTVIWFRIRNSPATSVGGAAERG